MHIVADHLPPKDVRALGVAALSRHFKVDFQEVFQDLDQDNSGCISKTEFKRYVTKILPQMQQKAEAAMPTRRKLMLFALNSAIPFVVFGALDNSIMILGGDVVDDLVGSTFQLSTLACAAIANTFADVLGISIGNTVEALSAKLGVPAAKLSPAQVEMPFVRRLGLASGSLGILVGCIIGMTPLLFMDPDAKALKEAFAKVDENGSGELDLYELLRVLRIAGLLEDQDETKQIEAALVDLGLDVGGKFSVRHFLALAT